MPESRIWRHIQIGTAAVLSLFLLASCSGDDSDGYGGPSPRYWAALYDWTDAATWTDPATWSDDKIRSFAYSGEKSHPDFYREDYSLGAPYYENTLSAGLLQDQRRDLCTDDRDSAYAWSEFSSVNSAYYRDLVSERETEKFFEFRRVYSRHPSDVILSRVHKRSYLNRDMFDCLRPTEVLGVFRARPMTAASARELIEYMWANGMIVDYGRPLSSDLRETEVDFVIEIYYTAFVTGDWGLCDTIHFCRALVRVAKASGAVSREYAEMRTLDGVCHD